jgi:hypothetical protein
MTGRWTDELREGLGTRQTRMGWGAPRMHGELRKLGIEISERTVSRLLAQLSRPPSWTCQTFLANHVSALA